MKKLLVVAVLLFTLPRVASADHIGIYTDATGQSCVFAPGFVQATIIHKYATGATASFFSFALPAGSTAVAFSSALPCISENPGQPDTGLFVCYGLCAQGTFVIGTLFAMLQPGVMSIQPITGQATPLYLDCDSVEHPATGGLGYVGTTGDCIVATEPTTWGRVKALYR